MTVPLACRLAIADLHHARLSTFCQVVGLAALLLPMLILLGIKNGVLADRTAALLRNPEDLRINISGQERFTQEFIEQLSQDNDVRFVGPHPIQLAVLADFAVPVQGGAVAPDVTLLATGDGDPYLPNGVPPPLPGEVILSAPLAGALGNLQPGDQIEALLNPTSAEPNGGFLTLTISAILPAGLWGRTGALLEKSDLFLIQEWAHGAVTGEDLNASRDAVSLPTSYPLIRLYAADVDGAFRLVEKLAADGFATGASLDKARELFNLRRALNSGFLTVAIVGLVGLTTTFAASLWNAILRNRRPISLLRLGGLNRADAVLMPVTQALCVGLLGWLAALGIYAALTSVLDRLLASTFAVEQSLARLSGTEIVASGVATFLVSAVSATFAAISMTAITPEEGFSDAS